MRRLYRFARRLWLKSEIAIIRDAIDHGDKAYVLWPRRRQEWLRMLNEHAADLSLLERNRKRAQPALSGLKRIR